MQYTICGFQQDVLLSYDLTVNDALILAWFMDFKETGKMKSKIFNGVVAYFIDLEHIANYLPIIHQGARSKEARQNKRRVSESFNRMAKCRLMEKHYEKHEKKGTQIYLSINPPKYSALKFKPEITAKKPNNIKENQPSGIPQYQPSGTVDSLYNNSSRQTDFARPMPEQPAKQNKVQNSSLSVCQFFKNDFWNGLKNKGYASEVVDSVRKAFKKASAKGIKNHEKYIESALNTKQAEYEAHQEEENKQRQEEEEKRQAELKAQRMKNERDKKAERLKVEQAKERESNIHFQTIIKDKNSNDFKYLSSHTPEYMKNRIKKPGHEITLVDQISLYEVFKILSYQQQAIAI